LYYTIFDTPIVRTFARWLSIVIFKLTGWRCEGSLPDVPKCVMIAAPHTSNWDLPIMLFAAFIMRAKIYWMGKDTIFRFPFRRISMWIGGIPVDRSKSNNVVQASIQQFKEMDRLILTVPPSGTRQKVMYWKSGFYHIAKGANVPILLGFIDYRTKTSGVGPLIYPTGDIETDMKGITDFYSNITGKYPERMRQMEVGSSPP
jgi:1-acyl-sn-glycerol-3-phosphate acyltransferase